MMPSSSTDSHELASHEPNHESNHEPDHESNHESDRENAHVESKHELDQVLVIESKRSFSMGEHKVEILSALGQLTEDTYYFKVRIAGLADRNLSPAQSPDGLGLLRVGAIEGGLKRELALREALKASKIKIIADLLAEPMRCSVSINLGEPASQPARSARTSIEPTSHHPAESTESAESPESDYLEEEYYPSAQPAGDAAGDRLMLLTAFPDEATTLEARLAQARSKRDSSSDLEDLEDALLLSGQICQIFQYVNQQGWCFVHLLPPMIQLGKPVQFYDLTSAYPVGAHLSTGLMGAFCAPELAFGRYPVSELMSSYAIGSLLYQLIHKQAPPAERTTDLAIDRPIPRIYQLLKICLAPVPEERFKLEQLRDLLLTTRKLTRLPKIHWETASQSTVGLSTNRLHNEDNYGIRQQQLSTADPLMLAVVADGMGGLAQGELASQLAVQAVLEEPLPQQLSTTEQWTHWLIELFQKANEAIAKAVREGGTTLSVVLTVSKELMIAHVGDSRIYLLRQGKIRQLSEDHSYVAMLVNSGQISAEESLNHPDRNVLTKSLGSKSRLSPGYVQVNQGQVNQGQVNQGQVNQSGQGQDSLLEHGDRLLLCSDGVWDLVPSPELQDIFNSHNALQSAVDEAIDRVLQRGASDNATLVALQFNCDESSRY